MVYRGAGEHERIGQLQRLIASEPQLRQERTESRRRYDAACEEVDRLIREEASAAEVEAAQSLRESLVAAEQQCDVKLAAVAAARVELAQLVSTRGAELRTSETPAGTELRALDDQLAHIDNALARIERDTMAVDPAQSAVSELADVVAAVPGTAMTALQVTGQVVGSVLGIAAGESVAVRSDRSLLRARLGDVLIPAAQDALRHMLNSSSELTQDLGDLRRLVTAPIATDPETSMIAVEAATVSARLGAILEDLRLERARLRTQRDELVAAQSEIISRASS